jgi:hypothetical protein
MGGTNQKRFPFWTVHGDSKSVIPFKTLTNEQYFAHHAVLTGQ